MVKHGPDKLALLAFTSAGSEVVGAKGIQWGEPMLGARHNVELASD